MTLTPLFCHFYINQGIFFVYNKKNINFLSKKFIDIGLKNYIYVV